MKSSIAYRGAILWNHLPGEYRKAVSLGSFIKSIHEQNAIKDIDFSNLYSKTFQMLLIVSLSNHPWTC